MLPQVPIVSFRRETESDWVATLACGHTQHLRHQPPWQTCEWVVSETGRSQHIGTELSCKLCLMGKLPQNVTEYKRTTTFDADNVPAGLLQSHALKANTWGEIVVEIGRVLYVLENVPDASFVLTPDLSGVVTPEAPHHVELASGARFFVRFLKAAQALQRLD